MKNKLPLLLLAFTFVKLCPASDHSDHWPVREEENIQKTLSLNGDPQRVVIDNVEGYVHVTGTTGSKVVVTAHKIIRAESDADAQEAKRDVNLQLTEKPGSVSIYYDAPWRCNHSNNNGCRGEQRHFYDVKYDIDVQVPRAARLVVSTVNSGDVHVDSTTGDFDVSDVNGGIKMTGIGGSGDVHTVNGPVSASFSSNPRGPCSFKSVNGALDVYFKPGLSADMKFKTLNGQIYSDFDVTATPLPVDAAEKRDGKYVYRSNRMHGGRVGAGGTEMSFDTLNGSIRLHQGALQNVSNND